MMNDTKRLLHLFTNLGYIQDIPPYSFVNIYRSLDSRLPPWFSLFPLVPWGHHSITKLHKIMGGKAFNFYNRVGNPVIYCSLPLITPRILFAKICPFFHFLPVFAHFCPSYDIPRFSVFIRVRPGLAPVDKIVNRTNNQLQLSGTLIVSASSFLGDPHKIATWD